jgi:DNA invertase Pin-like site-specific DNA recombinase
MRSFVQGAGMMCVQQENSEIQLGVLCWAIDRLGRSLIDLLGTIQASETCGVDLYLDQQSIDTTTPTGRLRSQGRLLNLSGA